jgi:hypothetical protein
MNDSHTSSALASAKAHRDEMLLRGNFLQYMLAERQLNKAGKQSSTRYAKHLADKITFRKKVFCCGPEINLHIVRGNTHSVVQVTLEDTMCTMSVRYGIDIVGAWFSWGGKPLKLHVPFSEYGLCEGNTVTINDQLLGGSMRCHKAMLEHTYVTDFHECYVRAWLPSPGGVFPPPALKLMLPQEQPRKGLMHAAAELARRYEEEEAAQLHMRTRHKARVVVQADSGFFSIDDEVSSARGLAELPDYMFTTNHFDDSDYDSQVSGTEPSSSFFQTFGNMSRMSRSELGDDNFILQAIRTLESTVDLSVVKLIEDTLIYALQMFRARDWKDVVLAVMTYIKFRTNRSLASYAGRMLSYIRTILITPDVQDLDETLAGIRDFRSFIAKWDTIKESSFGKKFSKVLKYLVSFGAFTFMGIQPEPKMFKAMESNTEVAWNKLNFVGAVVDFISMTVERILVFVKTGEWESFIHGEFSYQKWYDDSQRLKRLAIGLGNLEAFGTTYFAFVAELKQNVEIGKSIVKYAGLVGVESRIARSLLNDLEMLQSSILSTKAAQQERCAPFGLLVFGGSSVAKSMFTRMLFYHFGKLRGLPVDDEYRYVRNAADDFWSGFNSQQWCIQMDDIGYLNASKAMEDRSLMEIIQVINSVPLVPNQAALEDKGRTPVRAKFVVATSNAKDMNAAAYFHCPLAVQRRLPFVVTVCPKPEYARADSPGMVDPARIPIFNDRYPDIWNIKVERVVAAGEAANGRAMARHELVQEFNDVELFLDWFKEAITVFDTLQRKAMADDEAMKNFSLCPRCTRVENRCTCPPEVQAAGRVLLPHGKAFGDEWSTMESLNNGHVVYAYSFAPVTRTYMCVETRVVGSEATRRAYPVEVIKSPTIQASVDDDERVCMADIIMESMRSNQRYSGESILGKILIGGISLYHKYRPVRKITHWLLGFKCVRRVGAWAIHRAAINNQKLRTVFMFCAKVQDHVSRNHLAYKLLAGLALVHGIWRGYQYFMPAEPEFEQVTPFCDDPAWKNPCPKYISGRPCAGKCEMRDQNIQIQGQRLAVASSHFKTSEQENVWKKDCYETTTFDTTPQQGNYASLERDQVVKSLARNIARVRVVSPDGTAAGHALCVGGHLWVMCKHFFKGEHPSYDVDFVFEAPSEGCSRNLTLRLFRTDILFHPTRDQAWFEARGIEVKKDISSLIARPSLDGVFDGDFIAFGRNMEPRHSRARAILRVEQEDPISGNMQHFWRSYLDHDTIHGDCGGLLLAHKPVTVILGLHYMGGTFRYGFSCPLTADDVEAARKRFVRPLIQAALPRLNAPGTSKVLGALHHKSPVRYLEKGTLSVFGSFQGAHLRPRTRVRPTFLSEEIGRDRGWTLDVGAPELGGWQPWRHAYLDTCNQQHVVSNSDIDACVSAYVNDVMTYLSEEDKKNMQKLSVYDAINGIAGVKYIDKMNFNTSMGEPYNHSKKYHLYPDPTETAPEGKMFDDITLERVSQIMLDFENGFRTCSVFSGQQKDEARALAKLKAGKIRIFTACPTDLAIVIRAYLLPFVKVFQENPFVFEGAPGTVCQSREWTNFHGYLTQFGSDQLIAGDYGKFDKKMLAEWILAAFDVIARILEACGWSQEEVLPVYAMAEDIAFPVVNMNGDLVMFNGSNPSGHPLTVIVNCIVNALYMRYCYMKLYEREFRDGKAPCDILTTFKANVALLTYGDDNAAGVHKRAAWFNHTAVAGVLAEIGVEYTMADKESESVPFIHIDDVAFLKRKWVWNEEAQGYFCPLEEASIRKMLMIACRNKTVTDQAHMVAVLHAANNEWFWHGKERFEFEQKFLKKWASHPELRMFFPMEGATHEYEGLYKTLAFATWDELMLRYHNASRYVPSLVWGVESSPQASA